jgi:uncharacterized protein (TIGR03067 family)
MKPIVVVLLVALCPCAWSGEKDDPVKKDLKLLQGAWTMAALEVNGVNVPPAKLDNTVLTIKDDVYTITIKGKTVARCKLVLKPKEDPKHLDMIFLEGAKKDDLHKAIYRIDGDKLQICRGLNAEQARPNQFATWPDTNYFVVTWRRE